MQIITVDMSASVAGSGSPGARKTWHSGNLDLEYEVRSTNRNQIPSQTPRAKNWPHLAVFNFGEVTGPRVPAQIPKTPECLASGLSRDLPSNQTLISLDVRDL